jgi:hypothetical protein
VSEVNKVAIRYRDGRVEKGTTHDFRPGKPVFHIEPPGDGGVTEIRTDDLKAIFFVKDFAGRSDYSESKVFPETPERSKGRRIAVLFADGELLTGYTLAYDAQRPGFFIMPTDEMSNNDRVYVVRSAVKDVGIGPQADRIIEQHAGR